MGAKHSNLGDPGKVNVGSHLKTAADLVDFPVFPEGTESLLKKCMTRGIWSKYKDGKDKMGNTFKEAIFSGCKNTDSGIGVYAGSHDAYYTFSDLFDKLVETYHGHKKNDKHVSNMDCSQLVAPDLPADEAAMI
jgi:arginine kinase